MDISYLYESIYNTAEVSFSRSGGPGGQNVNKVNTKVTIQLNLNKLEGLSEIEMKHLRETLAYRLRGEDSIVIFSSETRSQRINLERAFSRLKILITASARIPKHRISTKPSRLVKEKRFQSKRFQSLKKSERHFVPDE